VKTQSIRLADIFVIGPLMLWAGWALSKQYPVRGAALALFGGATVIYNGKNYLEAEARR